MLAGTVTLAVIAGLFVLSKHYELAIDSGSAADRVRHSLYESLATIKDRREAESLFATHQLTTVSALPSHHPMVEKSPRFPLPPRTAVVMSGTSASRETGQAFGAFFRVEVYLDADDRVVGHRIRTFFDAS